MKVWTIKDSNGKWLSRFGEWLPVIDYAKMFFREDAARAVQKDLAKNSNDKLVLEEYWLLKCPTYNPPIRSQ